jgi:tetratricopeptide (TPR) repeat protein
MRALAVGCVLVCLAAGAPQTKPPSATTLLDLYAAGEFDAVVSILGDRQTFSDLLDDLKRNAPAWLDAGGPQDRARRELTAATVALEAARAGEWQDWKLLQHVPAIGSVQPPDSLTWRAPPQLIAWGNDFFKHDAAPRPVERWWQLAAVAVAERSEDFEFLLGSPFDARGNPQDEVEYLNALFKRFPTESRFVLAQGLALESRTWPNPRRTGSREAQQVFERLQDDDWVGAEASLRLGILRLRQGGAGVAGALKLFERVDEVTRDPFLLYLSWYFSGQLFEQTKRQADAERAYRTALIIVPHAQSASVALAATLARRGARTDAAAIIEDYLSARPPAVDPWRIYAHGDDRFWPELIARVRQEIHR